MENIKDGAGTHCIIMKNKFHEMVRSKFDIMFSGKMIDITFYHRPGCWLCDKAEEMLNGLVERYGINMTRTNIDDDDELYRLYRYDIPVLDFKDGSTLHGNIKKKELVKKLEENRV